MGEWTGIVITGIEYVEMWAGCMASCLFMCHLKCQKVFFNFKIVFNRRFIGRKCEKENWLTYFIGCHIITYIR
ncbi:hypothetical protein Lac2_14890 [Claveliimonas bilis]|uniref:Uncharacterized protein n=1 Tax=Claveliimonas bilis TaxID=3028070 RepID=A0ABM8I5D4_9FIRM|nr:hypothetical protein Lac1_24800 [Claveliimonas bilis]BDZ83355.1 hypothetical protein Lac2_14890 [Claveliimonas bilis]